MDLRQLEYFVAVARHRHFTRAAEALYVTQPALSQQIRRLEAELGLQLLARSPQGVELTPAGQDLLLRAEAILGDVAAARTAMDEHAGAERGSVRVAAAAGEALRLPAELAAFHAEHPGIRIALKQGSPREVEDLVRRGAADLAVVAFDAPPEGLDATPLAPEPLRLIGARGTLEGTVAIAELRGLPLILAERGTALREVVNATCEAAGFGPIPPFEVGDPVTARFLAAAGLGVSVVPVSWLEQPGPEVSVATLDPEPHLQPYVLSPAAGLTPAGRLLREQIVR